MTYRDNVTQSYEFDKVGNRLTKTEGTNTTNYTYNNVNEMLTAGSDSYTYDQNGNTLSGGGRDYAWDQQNRLKAVTKDGTTVRFTYRADGLRARKEVVGGLTIDYVYDGQTVIGEKRSDGKSVWYTPGPNGYISRTVVNDATGQVLDKEWFVYDGLGSCRAMVKPNAQGTEAVLTARMDYDVYGKVRTQSGSTDSKFKYVASIGHPTDEETGLVYMRARYYEPNIGRFVSEDPGLHGMNWYWYASDNPVNRVDLSGKSDEYDFFLISLGVMSLGLYLLGVALGARGNDAFLIDTAGLLLNLAILPAAVFIFAGVAGLNPSVAGQIVSGAAGVAGGYLASVLAVATTFIFWLMWQYNRIPSPYTGGKMDLSIRLIVFCALSLIGWEYLTLIERKRQSSMG